MCLPPKNWDGRNENTVNPLCVVEALWQRKIGVGGITNQ